jgi:hypothetical protein
MEKAFEIELREEVEVVRNAYKEPPGEPWDAHASTVLALFEGVNFSAGGPTPSLSAYTLERDGLELKRQALRDRWATYGPPEDVDQYGGREVLLALVEGLVRASYDLRRGDVELHLRRGWRASLEPELVEKALSKVALAPASFVWTVLGAFHQGEPERSTVVRLPEHILRAGHLTQAQTTPSLFNQDTEREVDFRTQALERLRKRETPGANVARVAWNPTAGEEIVHRALLEIFAQRNYPATVKLTSEEVLEACGWEYNENTLRDLGQALGLLSTRPALFAFMYRPQTFKKEKKPNYRKKETVGPLWNVTREAAKSTNRTLSWTIAPGLTSLEPEERFSIFFQVNPELHGDPAHYRAEPAGLLQRGNGGSAQVTADAIRLRGIFGTFVSRGKVKPGSLPEVVVSVEDLRKELQRGETVPKFDGLTERESLIVRYFLEAQGQGKTARAVADELEGLELKELRRALRRANVQEKLPRVPSVRAAKERLARALEVLRMEGEPYRVTGYTFAKGKKGVELRAVLEVK